MISQNTIQAVQDLNIVDVVNKYVTLKKKGATYMACCPFHNEKTPSFTVNKAKQYYKCFGCGKGGNGISFVMEHEKLTFPEAVEKICNQFSIEIEYHKKDVPPNPNLPKYDEVMAIAHNIFMKSYIDLPDDHWAKQLIQHRAYTQDTIDRWGIGYADTNFRHITDIVAKKGLLQSAIEISLCTNKSEKNYDFFNNRITFPIRNTKGLIVSFGGRGNPEEEIKYLNGRETPIYHKISTLFGLYENRKSICEKGYAIIVEGYTDVISLWQAGADNAVAGCGTAFTDEQAKKLKRYTNRAVLFYDNDNAGIKAAAKTFDILLANQFEIDIVNHEYSGKDPDDLCRELDDEDKPLCLSLIDTRAENAIKYFINKNFEDKKTERQRAEGFEYAISILKNVESKIERNEYIKSICKKHGFKAKDFDFSEKKYKEDEEIGPIIYEREDFNIVYRTEKYSFYLSEGFLIFIDYKLEDEFEDVKWIIRVVQTQTDDLIIEILHEEFCSAVKFKNILLKYMLAFKAKDNHLSELQSYLFNQGVPTAQKIIRFGYDNNTGFYVFSNGVYYKRQFHLPNKQGIVRVDDKIASLPITQEKYAKKSWFKYSEANANITFKQWYDLFCTTHGTKIAWHCVAFLVSSFYRDISVQNIGFSPILFLKGVGGSGKSSIARQMLTYFGTPPRDGNVNLRNKVTEAGLNRKMSQVSNSLLWVDEYVTDHPMEGVLQAAYDNAGVTKANSESSGIETATVELKLSLLMTTNFNPNSDPFFSRCIYIPVNKTKHTDEEKNAFSMLEKFEENGLAHIAVKFLEQRELIANNYSKVYNTLKNKISKRKTIKEEKGLKDRLINNLAASYTPLFILIENGKLHEFDRSTIYAFEDEIEKQILHQHSIMTDQSPLKTFFELIQLAHSDRKIEYNIHYKIKQSVVNEEIIYLNFPALYGIYKVYFMRNYHSQPADRETIKEEIVKFANEPYADTFEQIRFASASNQNKDIPIKDCCKLNYNKLLEHFSINFKGE